MPAGDVELLRYRSFSDISGESNLRRAPSEATVHECGANLVGFSMLKLSKNRLTVGDSVTVYWDIQENCSSNDWIGLFDLEYPTSLTNYLDCKQRGVTGARRGAIKWVLSRNIDLHNVENKCVFHYVYANTGSVRAISPTLFVHNPYAEIHRSGGRHQSNVSQDTLNEISVSGLSAFGLKKNIFGKPSPYVKLSVIPSRRHFKSWKHHHGQIAKTSSQSHTIDPNWQNEEFVFVGGNEDILEVEVRNKFSGTRPAFSRFLGKLSISLRDVFEEERNGSEFVVNKALCKRTPSDRIQGRIRLIIASVNSSGAASERQEARAAGRENRRPSDLNVLGTQGAASSMITSNPALRSSAPDLLRPSADLSPTASVDSQREPPSPVSPFNVTENGEPNVTNRRRNLPREMRPFSEFYSEEFVPLDPEISSPANVRRQMRTEQLPTEDTSNGSSVSLSASAPNREPSPIIEAIQEEQSNVNAEVVQNGEVEVHHPVSQVENHDSPEHSSAEAGPSFSMEAAATVPEVSEERHESQESPMEIVESEGDEIEEEAGVTVVTDQITDNITSELVNSVSSMRASVGSIELTEDSPLRIMEESELAHEEEASFSPLNVDSDDMEEEAPDGAYGYLYEHPNDGDDEMDSEQSTPDEEVHSISPTIIAVDGWTYEPSDSSEPMAAGASGVSPPKYNMSSIDTTVLGSTEEVGNLEVGNSEIGNLENREGVSVRRLQTEISREEETEMHQMMESSLRSSSPRENAQELTETIDNNDGESLQAGVSDSPITPQADVIESTTSSVMQSPPSNETDLSMVEEAVREGESVIQGASSSQTESQPKKATTKNDKSSPRTIVNLITRTERENQKVKVSSVGFPMDEGEPDCMDVTSVQNVSPASQMVVETRPSRSQSLVETKSNRNEHSVDTRFNRSGSVIEAGSSRNESQILNSRFNHNESQVNTRPQLNESQVDTRPPRNESLVDTRSTRSASLVQTRSDHSESQTDARNCSESLVDSRSSRRPAQLAHVSFSRTDDTRSSTRSEGHVSFVESVPIRPARRNRHLARSMSDTRGTRLNHRPERPERSRRRRTDIEPRVQHQASEPYHRSSLSDPVVVAVPVSAAADSPRSRSFQGGSQEAIFVASASSSVSVTPLPSPSLDSESSSPRSRDFEEVVAVPVTSTDSASPSSVETRAVLAAVSSPRETTTVTPVPSPTADQANLGWNEVEQRTRGNEAAPLLSHSSSRGAASTALSTPRSTTGASSSESTNPGAIPKSSPADINRENISKMLRTYVRSAQAPQRPSQTEDPRLRRESVEDDDIPLTLPSGRSRQQRHETVESTNGNIGLPPQGRERPPTHEAAVSSRRRSSKRHGGDRSHSHHERTEANPVHLQIQDSERSRREEQPLPPNWERGVDSHGRVYYIDHAHRTTTWTKPTRETPQNETNMNDINTHWQSLDRRYESFRRTLRGRNRQSRPPLPEASNSSNEGTPTTSRADTASRSEIGSRLAAGTPSTSSTPMRTESLPRPSPSSAATPPPSTSTPSTPGSSGAASSTSASSSRPSSRSNRSGMSSSARSAALLDSPAVKFITRPDFVDFIKNSGVAGQYYFQSQMLKLIISKVRADPANFEKYRHQVELVRFLNQFADPQIELQAGWDKKVDQNGRLYFIDHNTRTTTFIDPRLPQSGTTRRHRAGTETEPRRSRAPPPRPPPPRGHSRNNSADTTASATLTYNQQVVGFLSQPNIEEIIARKHPSFPRNMALKASIRRVQCEGERTLERLSNNVDFVMLLSLFEDQIMSFVPPEMSHKSDPASPSTSLPNSPVRVSVPTNRKSALDSSVKGSGGASSSGLSPAPYRRDFEAKVRTFHRQLYHKGYGQGPNKIKMTIRRDRLLEDAYDQIMKETARSLQRNRLEIHFAGEEGLDYGGPAREFFFLISRQIFNPYYGLFEYSANDTYTVQVSPVSLYVDNSHEWFRFCGRIVGLVIIHQHLLDAFFTRTFYKALLRSPCDLSDVESLDALFHQSMTWVIENNIQDVLDLTFTVSEEIFGQVTERELIPGGKDIAVTEENKEQYVNEMVKWRVERGVSEQMESIVRGFNEVIDPALMNIFDARELELVISGTADIDIKDWRRHTEYRSGYHDGHKAVKWFWKAVSSFDNEQRLRLLQFVTGTSSIPYEGFAALRGSTGPRKFSIERWGDFSKLPRAHTCFNRLDLPVYRSYEELLEKLTFAVEETGTFSIQ